MLELERDPLFKMDDIHDLTKAELRERTMEKVNTYFISVAQLTAIMQFRSMLHHLQNESVDTFKKRMEIVSLIDPGFWTRFGVHCKIFTLISK